MRYARKLAVSACLVSCLMFWMALTPQQIAVNSAVFSGYSDQQLEQAEVFLIATLAGVTINAANILSNAAPFQSYSDRQLQEAQTYLLSQISATGGSATNVVMQPGFNIEITTNVAGGNYTIQTSNTLYEATYYGNILALTNSIVNPAGTVLFAVDPIDTTIWGPLGGLFYVTLTNVVWGSGQVAVGNGALITNLLHANTVTVASGGSVALTKNADGSTNFALTVTGGSGLPGTNTVIAYGGDPATAAQTNWSAEANGGWFETNKSGAVNIASNGVFSATGPSGVNGALTLNDSSGAVELTATNGGVWTKANVEYGINTTTSFTPQINMLLEDQLFVSATNFSIAVANVPTASTRYSTMTISNSGNNASTILVTLTGFCALTNGSTVATSSFYVTNVTAKNQVAELNVRCRANGLTNGIVTHLYDK